MSNKRHYQHITKPFEDEFTTLLDAQWKRIEEMDDAKLAELVAAVEELDRGNCWWLTYEIMKDWDKPLENLIKRRRSASVSNDEPGVSQ